MDRYQVLIITNNPLVNNISDVMIRKVRGDILTVLGEVYTLVAQGHSLLSHPLAGSIKPNQNPYRSVLLSSLPGTLDAMHLKIAQQCLDKAEAMMREVFPELPGHHDLQLIDLELLRQALKAYQEGR